MESEICNRQYAKISISLQIGLYFFNFVIHRIARKMDILRMQKPKDIFIQFHEEACRDRRESESRSGISKYDDLLFVEFHLLIDFESD